MKTIQLTFEDWVNGNEYFRVFDEIFEPNERIINSHAGFNYEVGFHNISVEPYTISISTDEIEKIYQKKEQIYDEEIKFLLNLKIEQFENEALERMNDEIDIIIKKTKEHYLKEFSYENQKYLPAFNFRKIDYQWHKKDIDFLRIKLHKDKRFEFEVSKKFMKYFDERGQQPQNIEVDKEKPKINAKFYALYHWVLIEMGLELMFEKKDDNKYIRSQIESFAKEKYNETSSQGFYRAFIGIDITKKTAISNSFGNGYKNTIIEISENNAKVITHLKNYPN